jgi:uncharacterized membrane protein YebE (DUF533 family)
MTTFFEHQRSSYKKNYMRNLIVLAASDGEMDKGEMKLIFNIGRSRGLKDRQLDELLAEDLTNHELFIPEPLAGRMNLLYDFMQLAYADGIVNSEEIEFIKNIVAKFNLRQELADHLIDLFRYGAPTVDEWREFIEYVNSVFTKESF